MDQWLETSADYYRSNLMAHDIPTDIIGVIVSYAVQHIEIGDLVNVSLQSQVWSMHGLYGWGELRHQKSNIYYQIKHRYKSKHSRKRRSNYMHNCVIISFRTCRHKMYCNLHYIGWSGYHAWVDIKDIKPFILHNWEIMDYKNLLDLSIIKNTVHPCMPSTDNYKWLIIKIVLFTQQDKKITKEIITTFPLNDQSSLMIEDHLKFPNHIYLCSDILNNNILYLFAKLHPNGYR